MTLERAWVLLLLPLIAAFPLLEWRRARSRVGLLLKTAAFAAILLALSEPSAPTAATRMAVAILADTSESVTRTGLQAASEIAGRIERARGRHWTRVFAFARSTRELTKAEQGRSYQLQPTGGEAGRVTDLEAAILEAYARLPAGLVGRIVLITDGKENRGSVLRAAWRMRELGIPVDTYPLIGRPRPALRIESLQLPAMAFTGERFAIDLVVSSPRQAAGVVQVYAEGRQLGSNAVNLGVGENNLRVYSSLSAPGAIDLSIVIRAEGLGEAAFEQAIMVRRPRVLFVSQDSPEADSHLLAVLEAARFEVLRQPDVNTANLSEFQVIVFNNHNLEAIPPRRKQELEAWVKEGGGLLVIGGEQNIYVEGKKQEDPLERALPAKLAPPRSPEGTMVVLIVDKSSSMEGRKMELARLAAIGVIDNLRPVDLVGVLIFDNSFQWTVPIRPAADRSSIKRLVAGITPDGGTQIAPALSEGFRRALPVKATFKHIVLLTDGISEEGDSIALAKEAANQKVTISTVGLGQDVNRAYLEKVASLAKGKSYFLNDPSGLEQILLRDVMEHTGSTAVERPVAAAALKRAELLEGVDIGNAPPLKGYVKFISKPSADTVLSLEKRDPLLVRWQYGLGRAAVFTSDAKPRWAADWVVWKSFDRFWANVFRDLLPHSQAAEATLRFDSAHGDLIAEYRLANAERDPGHAPEVFAFGPNGFHKPVPLKRLAAGVYSGRIPIGNRRGLFRVRPLVESDAFPEVGLYRPEEETRDYGNDEALLRQIAAFTGGRFAPKPEEIFQAGGRAVEDTIRLWPGLLGLALACNLIELTLRKWRGMLEFLKGWRASRAQA